MYIFLKVGVPNLFLERLLVLDLQIAYLACFGVQGFPVLALECGPLCDQPGLARFELCLQTAFRVAMDSGRP